MKIDNVRPYFFVFFLPTENEVAPCPLAITRWPISGGRFGTVSGPFREEDRRSRAAIDPHRPHVTDC